MRKDETTPNCKYEDIIIDYKKGGYLREPITLTLKNPYLVTNYSVEKGTFSKILDIVCPAGRIITMCGSEDSGVDLRDFARSPHLYSIPHQFSIRCFSKDNVELSQFTEIRIETENPRMEINRVDDVLYGDLSLSYGERFKRKEERYYFLNNVILYGSQSLRLLAIKPDIDIARTELFMKCDLFTKVD